MIFKTKSIEKMIAIPEPGVQCHCVCTQEINKRSTLYYQMCNSLAYKSAFIFYFFLVLTLSKYELRRKKEGMNLCTETSTSETYSYIFPTQIKNFFFYNQVHLFSKYLMIGNFLCCQISFIILFFSLLSTASPFHL